MDPRQFVRNSNVEIRRPDTVISTQPQIQTQSASVFTDLRVGKLRPGIYNGVVNTLFTKDGTSYPFSFSCTIGAAP